MRLRIVDALTAPRVGASRSTSPPPPTPGRPCKADWKVGAVLGAAKARSADIVDAHVVAAVVEAGGGVVLTADEEDLSRLAAAYSTVQVVRV